jgi:hypothetical protein
MRAAALPDQSEVSLGLDGSVMSIVTPCQKLGIPSSSRTRTARSCIRRIRPPLVSCRDSLSNGSSVDSARAFASRMRGQVVRVQGPLEEVWVAGRLFRSEPEDWLDLRADEREPRFPRCRGFARSR